MLEFGNGVAVKVCGVTSTDDALACAAMGVEMLGLNFSQQSLRRISLVIAAEILATVRPRFAQTKFVGVFVDQDLQFVQTTATDLALDAVQLHGVESAEYVRDLRVPFVIKALRVSPGFSESTVADYRCAAILLDNWSASAPGGTGETFPWSIAARLRPCIPRLILAGGLTNENVVNAIQMVQPFAVDVCSGVEERPGQKNYAKVRRFLKAVRAVKRRKASAP